jgi:hypothetical protein
VVFFNQSNRKRKEEVDNDKDKGQYPETKCELFAKDTKAVLSRLFSVLRESVEEDSCSFKCET